MQVGAYYQVHVKSYVECITGGRAQELIVTAIVHMLVQVAGKGDMAADCKWYSVGQVFSNIRNVTIW